MKDFLDKTFVKNAPGKPAETVIKNTSADIRKRQKELESERKKKEQEEKRLREQTKEIMELRVCPRAHQAGVLHAISPISVKLSQYKGSIPKLRKTHWFWF